MSSDGVKIRLNEVLVEAGLEPLDDQTADQFERYLSLIVRWNARLNLTSVRAEDSIISKHLAESIACARALPAGIATLLDFGSGAGFPGIPIALCRLEIAVTLAESQGKKAAFLQEGVRTLGIKTKVYAGRAEGLAEMYGCVSLRAVDKMPRAVAAAAQLVAPGGWLALMTTGADVAGLKTAAGEKFSWSDAIRLPRSEDRILALGKRQPENS
jgi:16S rRNA (guanine527-N7)-methyltransferase